MAETISRLPVAKKISNNLHRLHVSRSKYPSLETLTTTEETPANEYGITDNQEKDQVVPKIRGHDSRKEMR